MDLELAQVIYFGVSPLSRGGHFWYAPGWAMIRPSPIVGRLGGLFETCSEVCSYSSWGELGVSGSEGDVSTLRLQVDRRALSAAAWVDRSGDRRDGSVSVLVRSGAWTAREIVEFAAPLFPGLLERQRRPLTFVGEVRP